jgi:hypothetical protein
MIKMKGRNISIPIKNQKMNSYTAITVEQLTYLKDREKNRKTARMVGSDRVQNR